MMLSLMGTVNHVLKTQGINSRCGSRQELRSVYGVEGWRKGRKLWGYVMSNEIAEICLKIEEVMEKIKKGPVIMSTPIRLFCLKEAIRLIKENA